MSWLHLALLGGAIGVDSTAFPQIMVSRPLVAGALTGLLFGRPYEGLLLGALLEVFHIATLPIGAARYPEAGTAAVSGTAAYMATTATLQVEVLFLAGVFALAWERVAGASVVAARRANEALVVDPRAVLDPVRAITVRHVAALSLDFLRGALVSLVGGLTGALVLRVLAPLWDWPDAIIRGAIAIAVATVLASALVVFGGWRERRLIFLFGILCGSLLSLFR